MNNTRGPRHWAERLLNASSADECLLIIKDAPIEWRGLIYTHYESTCARPFRFPMIGKPDIPVEFENTGGRYAD